VGKYTPEQLYYNDIIRDISKIKTAEDPAVEVYKLVRSLVNSYFHYRDQIKRKPDDLYYIQAMIEEEYGIANSVRDILFTIADEVGLDIEAVKKICWQYLPTKKQQKYRMDRWKKYNKHGSVHRGRVKDIKINSFYNVQTIQGVKSRDAHKYRPPDYYGGNGTYRKGYRSYNKSVLMIVKLKGAPYVKVEIAGDLLAVNERAKITSKLVDTVLDNLKNTYLFIKNVGPGEFILDDPEVLII